jgi:dephospho-CoA kinase
VPAIGITGGISTGKTTFCGYLREVLPDAKIFDADIAARELVSRDPQVKREIQDRFGADIYSSAGDLNRARLRAIVFADARQRRLLEGILHPRIRLQWSDLAQRYRKSSEFFFADIPLLYETGGEALCDWVVVVACSDEIQRKRLAAKTGLPADGVSDMISSQMNLKEKIKRAKHVVWNNDGTDLLRRQTEILVELWQSQRTIS